MNKSLGLLVACAFFSIILTAFTERAYCEIIQPPAVPGPVVNPFGPAAVPAGNQAPGKTDLGFTADFETGICGFAGGARVVDNTFNKSKGAFKATPDLNDQWNSCKVTTDTIKQGKFGPGIKGLFQVGPATTLTFAYYLEDNDWLFVNFWSDERQMTLQLPIKAERAKWTTVQIKFWEENLKRPGPQQFLNGDWISMLTFITGAARQSPKFILDDIVVCTGPVPADLPRAVADRLAEAKLLNSDPKKDGYYITELILANLKRIYKKEDAVPSSIGLLGDDIANSPLLVRPIMTKELKGRTLLAAQSYSGDKIDLKAVMGKLTKAAKRNKPEVMLVIAGYSDVTIAKTAPQDVVSGIRDIVKKCIELGICPVLVNFARPQAVNDPFTFQFGDINRQLMSLAIELQVPLIDMYSVMGNREKPNTYFAPTGKFNKQGYELLNNLFYRVYRLIEWKVLERGEPITTFDVKEESKEPAETKPAETEQQKKAKEKIDKQIEDVEI